MTAADYAGLSNLLMDGVIVIYSLAILAYAAEMLTARVTVVPARENSATKERLLVGAAGPAEAEDSAPTEAEPEQTVGPGARSEFLGRVAVALTAIGWAVQLGEILTRGIAVDRWPWGNMYEFTSTLCFVAVTGFLVLLRRHQVRFLGMYLMGLVVLGLGLDVTVLYEKAGPLVPALHSYWIAIHVTAVTTAIGLFVLGAVLSGLYLLAARHSARGGAGGGLANLARRLPSAAVLDSLAYRVIAVAFPIWTFGVVAGAIWAEQAWGRYWGWDPKETWSFIVWVIYAGYLHARVTGGWRGKRAAVIALIGFAAILINYFVVNIWIVGFHSYA